MGLSHNLLLLTRHNIMGYALESYARILNMVPTKKVEKTPYELWHGKVPNLSYLKERMGYYFYYPPENKIFIARFADFNGNGLITQEASRSIGIVENPLAIKLHYQILNLDKWLEAINTEMQSIKDNNVWSLVDLPPNGKTVGIK
ncbi:hypothetical protein Tco_1325799 [Tanacetum coccineum]